MRAPAVCGRALAIALTCVALTLDAAAALAAPAPGGVDPAPLAERLDTFAARQAEMAQAAGDMRALLVTNQHTVAEMLDELRRVCSVIEAQFVEVKAVRADVAGIDGASGAMKQDVAGVGRRVEAMEDSLRGLRVAAVAVSAIVIGLQLLLTGLVLRRHR